MYENRRALVSLSLYLGTLAGSLFSLPVPALAQTQNQDQLQSAGDSTTQTIPNFDQSILDQAQKILSPGSSSGSSSFGSSSFGSPTPPNFSNGILPPREDAIGGGNPFEGLGRTDDTNPSRKDKFDDFGNALAPAAQPAPGTPLGAGTQGDDPSKPPGEESQAAKEKEGGTGEEKDFFSKPKPHTAQAGQRHSSFSVPDPAAKLALDELRSGRYEQALTHLENLQRLYPKAFELDYLCAIACVMQRRFGEAEKYYRKVLEGKAPAELQNLAHKGLLKLGKNP